MSFLYFCAAKFAKNIRIYLFYIYKKVLCFFFPTKKANHKRFAFSFFLT